MLGRPEEERMRANTAIWTDEAEKRSDELVALRRDFHRHPELSFEERRTAEIVARRLHEAGLEVRTGIARTGVVAMLRGARPGRTVAWRADIDALPLTETLDLPFRSATPGVMHACGHDGHTAVALVLAEILAARRAELAGTAVFLFQPAEEVFGGARPMLDEGALDDPRVDEVYGLHFTTRTRTGLVAVRPGPVLSSADFFDIEIRGEGGHGAYPHLSVDPITVGANVTLGLSHLVAREVSAQDTAVLTVGQITGGTKHNIIPETAVMRGSIRAFDAGVRAQLRRRLAEYAREIARAYRAEASVTFLPDDCPAVVNHAAAAAFVADAVGAELGREAITDDAVSMASDDVSLFLESRPGCYFFVGAAPESGPPRPHHSPEFELHEGALPIGLRAALAVMGTALAAGGAPAPRR
jgi:amidohydrolase